jgi:thymidylate synthase (FAD)
VKVTLLTRSRFDYTTTAASELFRDLGWYPSKNDTDCDLIAEFAGRSCYQSWNRPNPKTASNEDYLKNILRQQHESVLEHASATFYVTGVSRSLTHELIRHRHLSYSQLSQRFVDESEAEMIKPPALAGDADLESWVDRAREDSLSLYNDLVQLLTREGRSRKEAREAARAVLPNATETKLVVTGNMRAWRDVLMKRGSIHADAEIRLLAIELYRQLSDIAPNTFQDIKIGHENGHDVLVKEEL